MGFLAELKKSPTKNPFFLFLYERGSEKPLSILCEAGMILYINLRYTLEKSDGFCHCWLRLY